MNIKKISQVNFALDTNTRLKDGFNKLVTQYGNLTETQYMEKSLTLLEKEGISLTIDELKKLLILRRQTDKMLQEEKLEQDINKKQEKIK
ncbi:MAG: hypothetical protein RR549_01680 [Oscillospiraceae bacterium]